MPDPSPSSEAAAAAPAPVFDPATETTETLKQPDEQPFSPAHPAGLACPTCGTVSEPGARFCEVDGTALGVCACVDGGDGFCVKCGMKMATVFAPDPQVGAATHVGVSHDTNQDAVAVDRCGDIDLLVVCDGVSSSSHGDRAAAEVAHAALASLTAAAQAASPLDPEAALHDSVRAGHRAACEAMINIEVGMDPPGTTFVAAIVRRGAERNRIDVAWVGDSRAYLVSPDSMALTHDHSFVNMMVDGGAMTEAEAMRSPYAHAITHCMGPLESPDPEAAPEPSFTHVEASSGARLVLCSDGLWNYFPAPTEIAGLVAEVPEGADAVSTAIVLVNRALAMGGHDDVTVAVSLLDPASVTA